MNRLKQALRASEARFLGVSLGGAASADGIPCSQLDASTRHREASQAVGKTATERLIAYVCLGISLKAASALLGVSRQAFVADLDDQVIRGIISDIGILESVYCQRRADQLARIMGYGDPCAQGITRR